MRQDELYKVTTQESAWRAPITTEHLDLDLLQRARLKTLQEFRDSELASTLLRLAWDELERFGTDSSHTLKDHEIKELQRCLTAVLGRIGIDLQFPWSDFQGFRTYWKQNGGYGSWAARRKMLNDLLSPVETRLQQIEDGYHQGDLAHGVSSRESVGWPRVDEEIRALRERFQTASTTQDYRDVGNRCAAVLDALSATVYDPDLHLQDGETVPPVNKSKERIGRYIEHSLTGSENQKIRDLTRKVIELSHSIKHSPAPTRRYAGIAADSVILLTHILGRLDEDD